MRRFIMILLAAGLAATSLSAAETISFGQALRLALDKNPSAARARIDVDVARAQRSNIRSTILPQLDFYGTATRNKDEVAFEFEDGSRSTVIPLNDWTYRLVLSQPLYAGGREMKTLRQATLGIENAERNVRRAEDALLLGVAANYLAIVEGSDLVEVEQKNLELARQRRAEAEAFFEAGEVTKVDLVRAETAIKAAERRVTAAAQARDAAASRLRVDLALDAPLAVEKPDLALPDLPSDAELIARAEAARPDMQQAIANVTIARLESSKQRSAYFPTITANANYTKQRASFPTDSFTAVALNFYLPIYSSGELGARVAMARQREKQAELALEEIRRQVREEVERAILDLRTAETNLDLAREQLLAAEAEHGQILELYRAQEATSLDLASAESALGEARRAVVAGTLDLHLSRLRLWYTVGGLKEALNIEESR